MTWASLGTLAGAAVAVVVVANTVRKLTNWDSPWIPFIVSVLLVVGTTLPTGRLKEFTDWLLAGLNACLLFCTATGLNDQAVVVKIKVAGALRPFGARTVKWLQPWLTAA